MPGQQTGHAFIQTLPFTKECTITEEAGERFIRFGGILRLFSASIC